ncbi:hypothetical protein FACS189418_6940 [Clostridia bacterium]|nr:hypothetical protein FACS189418_6940 [Clostridia bacterium]
MDKTIIKALQSIQKRIKQLPKIKISAERQALDRVDTRVENIGRRIEQINQRTVQVGTDNRQIEETQEALRETQEQAQALGEMKKINLSDVFVKAGASIDKLGVKLYELGKKAVMAGGAIAAAFGAKAIKEVAQSALGMENISASFSSLIGDAEQTKQMFGIINDFSLNSAFESKDITAVSRYFLGIGKNIKETGALLYKTGDIAGATGADFNGLGLVMSQIMSNGKLNGQDWLQLLNNGAGGLREYIFQASKGQITAKNWSDAMREGKITVDIFNRAVDLATQKGGRMFEGTLKQSQTLSGRLSNLSETLLNIGLDIIGINKATGEIRADSVFDRISQKVQYFIDYLNENQDVIDSFAEKVRDGFDRAFEFLENVDYQGFFSGLIQGFKELARFAFPIIRFFAGIGKLWINFLGGGNEAAGLGKAAPILMKYGMALRILGLGLQGLGKITKVFGSIRIGNRGGQGQGVVLSGVVNSVLKNLGSVAVLWGAAKTIEEFAKAIQKIEEVVPEINTGFLKKLVTLGITITGMGTVMLGIGAAVKRFPKEALAGGVALLAMSGLMIVLSEALQAIDENVPELSLSFVSKLGSMGVAVAAFSALIGVIGALIVGSAGITGLLVGAGIATISGIGLTMLTLAKAIQTIDQLPEIDYVTLQVKVQEISEFLGGFQGNTGLISSLKKALESSFMNATTSNFSQMIKTLLEVSEQIKQLEQNLDFSFDAEKVKNSIQNILSVVDALKQGKGFWASLGEFFTTKVQEGNISDYKDILSLFVDMVKSLNDLGLHVNYEPALVNIGGMKEVIARINELFTGMVTVDVPKHAETLQDFVKMAKSLNELGLHVNYEPALINIGGMKEVIARINDLFPKKVTNNAPNYAGTLNDFVKMANSLNGLGLHVNYEPALINIGGMKEVITRINDLFPTASTNNAPNYAGTLNDFVKMANSINELGLHINYEPVLVNIGIIRHILSELQVLGTDYTDLSSLGVEKIVGLMDFLKTEMKFDVVGEGYMLGLNEGIARVDINSPAKAKIDELVKSLEEKHSSFVDAGKRFGEKLVDGFKKGISSLANTFSSQLTALNALSSNLYSIGQSLGRSLNEGISSVPIQARATVQEVGRQNTQSPVYLAKGGGVDFRPKGTDTVPAMLSKGEFVTNERAVKTVGLPLMEAVNRLDFNRAFSLLAEKVTGQTRNFVPISHIVNHVNQAKVTQNIYSQAQNYNSYQSLSRYLRTT